jgi:predicted metal-dependent RNase
MPLDFCHPEAPHKKLRMPEWYVSSLMMDRALDAIVRRVKHLDREHDIPYLAGYSLDDPLIKSYRKIVSPDFIPFPPVP